MSLTYQPFAETPELERISQDLHVNVGEGERVASSVLGIGLAIAGLARGGLVRWTLLAVGGALLGRGFTGHCSLYSSLGLKSR